jgi:hypothetical protein
MLASLLMNASVCLAHMPDAWQNRVAVPELLRQQNNVSGLVI